jgi:2-polyprenyl-6-methoxyphenol hydroxylase-like FAD-dependent oxidoreductase
MENFSDKQTRKFDVIIVGCSVAGLTLANALSKRKIDYVVLESHNNLPPPLSGNALTLLPNGLRILSQLGVLEDIKAASQSISSHSTWLANGCLLKTVNMMQLPSSR